VKFSYEPINARSEVLRNDIENLKMNRMFLTKYELKRREGKEVPFKFKLMTSVKSVGCIIMTNMSFVMPALFTKMSTGPT
jgi:hypothetical protein